MSSMTDPMAAVPLSMPADTWDIKVSITVSRQVRVVMDLSQTSSVVGITWPAADCERKTTFVKLHQASDK